MEDRPWRETWKQRDRDTAEDRRVKRLSMIAGIYRDMKKQKGVNGRVRREIRTRKTLADWQRDAAHRLHPIE